MRAFWLFLVAFGLGAKRHWHILFAIILGVVAGLFFPTESVDSGSFFHQACNFFGQAFIGLITMIVIPLIVSSLIVGICSLGDSKQLGRMGAKVLGYFLAFMCISALLGGALAFLIEPGTHVQAQIQHHGASFVNAAALQNAQAEIMRLRTDHPDLQTLFFNMIPTNLFFSLSQPVPNLVPLIIFTLIFGAAIASIGDAGRPIVSFFEALFTATMRLTDWLMVLAVPGVFALAFITVSTTGIQIFEQLYPYAGALVLGLLVQVFVIFPIALKAIGKINFMNLYRAVSEATMVAFGTASSSATLPITIACCERRAGISNRVASFVLPTGATINKTGTTLFEVLAVIFLCQAYGIQLEAYHWIMIMIFSIIASIGAAGIPSTGMITMSIVFSSIGNFDLKTFGAGIAMLWAIDRILDMCRTVVNVLSSCTVAALVAASEGELNRDVLNNQDKWSDVVS